MGNKLVLLVISLNNLRIAMQITDILSKFAAMSPTVREKGKLFEKFIREFYRLKPNSDLTEVWLWSDWPLAASGKDTGIDLVGKTFDGEYWAIQCKFYDPQSTIAKPDIDSFLAASSKTFLDESGAPRSFAYRLVVATCPLGPNADSTLNGQNPPAGCLNALELDYDGINWDVFWNEFDRQFVSSDAAAAGAAADSTLQHLESSVRQEKKQLRPHQQQAFDDVLKGFQTHDRGKLIMACGTGKTFTSLRIAEGVVPPGGTVLYLVPSLALIAQTLRGWTVDAERPMRPMLVCSDAQVHEQDARRKSLNDETVVSVADLAHPATTKPDVLVARWNRLRELSEQAQDNAMTVVFSTYQSLQVIADAQAGSAAGTLPPFDLIICDEAHRTTGVTLSGSDESAFVRIHDNNQIQGKKRLYMTATPRLYGESAKKSMKEKDADAVICSMDDVQLYGPEFHRLGFGKAVDEELLTDYRVIVLTIDEEYTRKMSTLLSLGISDAEARTEDGEIQIDDVSKILGCWSGLCKRSKYILPDGTSTNDFSFDPEPMKRAVAFCSTIKNSRDLITPAFERITERASESEETCGAVRAHVRHIDGTFGANERKNLLDWIKAEPEAGTCRILSNVRCLSEGVDVPSLDAVLFLSPRNSQVDVVQSLGRVMRKSPGKKYGYIILPVAIPANKRADEVLNDNKRYRVVWEVLRALRAHDERFNVWINQLQFNDKVNPDKNKGLFGAPDNLKSDNAGTETVQGDEQLTFEMDFQDAQKNIIARVVQKCGQKDYLEEWAKEIALIAAGQIDQIREKLTHPTDEQKKAFDEFVKKLQTEINPSVDQAQAIEMLTQHFVTKPVFDALFSDYSFVKNNVVSQAIQTVLDAFQPQETDEEKQKLADFYREIRYKVEGITSSHGKQQVIIKLYDQFFRAAFPKVAEKLGIVYTPIEVVDFIVHSVEYILKKHFRRRLSNKTVHILDPFTGTGTFIVRLIQSGLIDKADFRRKINSELHANEIVLLAYYIAAINIEEAIHEAQTKNDSRTIDYEPFPGIVLTDTFQLNERPLPEDPNLFGEDNPNADNSERIIKQRRKQIEVIIGNPPYSVGQGSANDNNQNLKYPKLDKRVEETYVAASSAILKNSLYDSYIKAFRWASDRIEKNGVVAFVTNGGWIDGNATSGFRKCLLEEFSDIYLFNLRGNARTSGELRRKESGNVFGIGTRTPITITVLVKAPGSAGFQSASKNQDGGVPCSPKCRIHYYDIGDYLTREKKLALIKQFHSIEFVPWEEITPNEHGDWINQRGDEFPNFYVLGAKNGESAKPENAVTFFEPVYSGGMKTNRDSWVYNYSQSELFKNIHSMLSVYNQQVSDYSQKLLNTPDMKIDDVIDRNPRNIAWTVNLEKGMERQERIDPSDSNTITLYRPFCKQLLYYDKKLIERPGLYSLLFPTLSTNNLVICVPGIGSNKDYTVLISDSMPCYDTIDKSQCFPLYYYEPVSDGLELNEGETAIDGYVRRDGITDAILAKAREKYASTPHSSLLTPNSSPTTSHSSLLTPNSISKEDIFYYVYGILHHPTYREKFAPDLKKSLARLPLVSKYEDFKAFSEAGRKLAELHLNYDDPQKLRSVLKRISKDVRTPFNWVDTKIVNRNVHETNDAVLYNVNKMRFDKSGKEPDKTKIVYNAYISIEDIPLEAYEYVVNGKSALEWIMERYAVTTNKDSGIINDPNQWNDGKTPRYIVDLIQSVVTVSVNTMRIVRSLPGWEE